jgi:Tfp pilus assembly protein PilO
MLGERRILLIGLVVMAGLAVAAALFLYMPNIAKRNRNRAEVAKLDKEIKELREMAAGIEQLRRRVIESEKQVAEFNARVARYDSLYYLVQEITDAGRRNYKLEFVEIRPPGKDTLMLTGVTAPLVGIPYQLTIRGRYLDIGRFIESLDRFRYFVRVPELEILGKDEIRPFVEARLLINLYATRLAQSGARS